MTFTDTIINDFTKVLDLHGTTITIDHVTSEIVNEEGDITPTYSPSASTALIGELNYNDRKLLDEGVIEAGSLKLFMKATDTVAVNDKITIATKEWIVKSVKTPGNIDTPVFKIAFINPYA